MNKNVLPTVDLASNYKFASRLQFRFTNEKKKNKPPLCDIL